MMKLWIAFISLLVRLAVWLKVHFRSILWKAQFEETKCVLGQVDGSAPHHGEDQLVQGTVVVDASDSISLTSRDAPDFGLEPILSAISEDEDLKFHVSYKSSGEVDKPDPYLRNIWKTIVKSVSKDRNLCIDITRHSGASQPTVSLSFEGNFVAEEEISVMFMEEFANAIRSNPRIEVVFIITYFEEELDRTLVTRFGTLVVNMFQVMLKSPSLQSAYLISGGHGGLSLDRAASESLASALRNNLTLIHFSIENNGVCFSDTEGLKLFLEPLMIGGEGSHQGLETLELDTTGIDEEKAEAVASMLRHNTSLTSISLRFNKMGPRGAACIAEALRSNTTLRKLDLSFNTIYAAGLKAVVASLTHNMADGDLQPNSSLIDLRIAGVLEIEDMELLETLVRQNTSLLRLDLANSSLLGVADNVIRLLEALKSNKCLEEVLLGGCGGVVGRRVLGTIFDLLEVNHHLKELDLEMTPLEEDGGAEMVKAVLEQKAKRNMWEVLQAMATARPNSARIFLCGYPFAGEPMNQFQEAKLLLLLFLG
jgi:Ran GTPase-activating protein (RanGAP) involved in mRNA processing and transport